MTPARGSRGEAVAHHRFEGIPERRHVVTDTLGFLVRLVIHTADIQDRDGAPIVLKSIRQPWPWLRRSTRSLGRVAFGVSPSPTAARPGRS